MLRETLVKQIIRDVPDFPAEGVIFRDITPVLQDATAFREVVDSMTECVRQAKPDVIVGIESRGFILGAPVALQLKLGFVPVRKAGKLPADTISAEYALEYGTNVVEMHRDAIEPGMKVAVVDDLLATGGTARAAVELVEELGGTIAGLSFLIELEFLHGRKVLDGYDICSLIKY
ncbi:MAG: adenine phosphoribosyltransferase [Armatimonadetes bacterium]|jgi:adenine phosphoribosyltransferase|nr:adenine phosphoribosyltransferase [Armatimonadota bacterium]